MMHKLWITLPAFSPDYSGVCSAFYDLGGLTVIHDASGCTGNYTGYDEPRYYGSDRRIFCSGLREIDAVLGRDDKLVDEILQACEDLKPTMITVLGSPVPTVIGTDFTGLARELEERSGLPAFGFSTTGLERYDKGVSDSMLALLDRFADGSGEKQERGVNILGVTPLDLGAKGNDKAIEQWLEANGFQVTAPLMMGTTKESIAAAPRASVNLVPCAAGMEAAVMMEKKYGIPWVAALPAGDAEDALGLLEAALRDGRSRVLNDKAEEGDILIVAEQMQANALRHALLKKYPGAKVTAATMFGKDERLAAPGDLDIPDEAALRGVISSGRFRKLVGDPLFAGLIEEGDGIMFYPLPHPAVSSKLHWDAVPIWLSDDIERLTEKIAKEQDHEKK